MGHLLQIIDTYLSVLRSPCVISEGLNNTHLKDCYEITYVQHLE